MGGAIACKATIEALKQSYEKRIQGLIEVKIDSNRNEKKEKEISQEREKR